MRTKVTLVLVFLNVALFFFIFKFERGWRTERASLEARRRVLGPESADIRTRLEGEGVDVVAGRGRLVGGRDVEITPADGEARTITADAVLLATGATPRVLPQAPPDGERILTWTQVYGLTELPERLVVVGSGVTGAEFAGAFNALGSDVVLVSSRDQVLPGEDPDAAAVIDEVFRGRGMTVLSRSRAQSARRAGDGVVVTLADGREVGYQWWNNDNPFAPGVVGA